MVKQEAIIGCLLGTAVGDAMGLACEGLSASRQAKLFPDVERFHFLFGRGMISDDTEHTCMVAQSLIVSAGDSDNFVKNLSWRFRWWLLGLPAGVGFATLRSILKLWAGISPERSGVFSAGNGPAMRIALIGVCYGNQPDTFRELVRRSTRITHTDPKAELGALAVALAAHTANKHSGETFSPAAYSRDLQTLLQETTPSLGHESPAFFDLVNQAVTSAQRGQTTQDFARELGLARGVSGYIYHTLPVVLHAWFSCQNDFRSVVTTVIRCGGDTDTTAAIAGAIVGAGVGKQGIPAEWLDGLCEWPRNAAWIEKLGERLAEVTSHHVRQHALPLPISGIFLRNLFFMGVVLLHGFRRLFPPY